MLDKKNHRIEKIEIQDRSHKLERGSRENEKEQNKKQFGEVEYREKQNRR